MNWTRWLSEPWADRPGVNQPADGDAGKRRKRLEPIAGPGRCGVAFYADFGRPTSRAGSGPMAMGSGEAIDTNELIARRPRPLDEQAIKQTLAGQVCVDHRCRWVRLGRNSARLVGRFEPSKLVLVDRSRKCPF